MHKKLIAVSSALFMIACGSSEPCQQAIDARVGCMAEAGIEIDNDTLEAKVKGVCAVVGVASVVKQEINDWAECQTKVLDHADCSTTESAEEAIAKADACEKPF
jgi:hypothetical protein